MEAAARFRSRFAGARSPAAERIPDDNASPFTELDVPPIEQIHSAPFMTETQRPGPRAVGMEACCNAMRGHVAATGLHNLAMMSSGKIVLY